MSLLLPGLLAGWLTLGSAGCAVLPIALDRTRLPSSRVALAAIEEARGYIALAQAHSQSPRAAGQPVSSYGSVHAAYRRWAQDQVRELPDVQTDVLGED